MDKIEKIAKPNFDLVTILPDQIAEKTEGGIVMADSVRANEAFRQNVGEVISVGEPRRQDEPLFAKPGMRVSFYRNAAIQSPQRHEDGRFYLIIRDEHITAQLQTNAI